MDAKSESVLYNLVFKAANSDYALLPQSTDALAPYIECTIGDHLLHIVGGQFGTLGAVNVIHNTLLDTLEADPNSWLLLFEGASENLELMVNKGTKSIGEAPLHTAYYMPDIYYLQELSNIYRLPTEEALPDLQGRSIMKYIRMQTGLKPKQVKNTLKGLTRRALPIPVEPQNNSLPEDAPLELLAREEEDDEIIKIFDAMGEQDPITATNPMESQVLLATGQYIVEEYLPKLLSKHPSRPNVLMVVGTNNHLAIYNHLKRLEAFNEKEGVVTILQ